MCGSLPSRVLHLAYAFPDELSQDIVKPDIVRWIDVCSSKGLIM